MSIAELDISLEPGRKARALTADFVGNVEESDLAMLAEERGTQPTLIKRIGDRHHALARALATGMKDGEASAVTGYTPSRISILKGDPSFRELVSHYKTIKDSAFADFQERAASVAMDYLHHIADKLEEAPEEVSLGQALSVVKELADRTGNAPVAKSVQVNATVDLTDRLARARARVIEGAKIVEPAT